jgi:hypothetical protein
MAKYTGIKTESVLIIAGVGLLAWAVYKPLRELFNTFGITQSKVEQNVQKTQSSGIKSPFSPLYWKQFKNAHLITIAQADAKAKAIENSIGYFQNRPDFAKILAIFKTLQYKTQVSFLAQRFQALFKQDLLEYLKSGKSGRFIQNALSENQLQTLIDLVNNLK